MDYAKVQYLTGRINTSSLLSAALATLPTTFPRQHNYYRDGYPEGSHGRRMSTWSQMCGERLFVLYIAGALIKHYVFGICYADHCANTIILTEEIRHRIDVRIRNSMHIWLR